MTTLAQRYEGSPTTLEGAAGPADRSAGIMDGVEVRAWEDHCRVAGAPGGPRIELVRLGAGGAADAGTDRALRALGYRHHDRRVRLHRETG